MNHTSERNKYMGISSPRGLHQANESIISHAMSIKDAGILRAENAQGTMLTPTT